METKIILSGEIAEDSIAYIGLAILTMPTRKNPSSILLLVTWQVPGGEKEQSYKATIIKG